MEGSCLFYQLFLLSLSLIHIFLNAYAQALPPSGTLSTRMRHMRRDMVNMDTRKINEMISDIRNAALCHQKEAALVIDRILGRSAIVTVGNEKCIMRDKDVFDQEIGRAHV